MPKGKITSIHPEIKNGIAGGGTYSGTIVAMCDDEGNPYDMPYIVHFSGKTLKGEVITIPVADTVGKAATDIYFVNAKGFDSVKTASFVSVSHEELLAGTKN